MLGAIKGVLPAWPEWALDVLLVMSVLLIATIIFSTLWSSDDDDDDNTSGTSSKPSDAQARGELHKKFDKFRTKYISVYLVIMLADWMYVHTIFSIFSIGLDWSERDPWRLIMVNFSLHVYARQGTHMYTLYLSYNVNISALFLTGFLSGAFFAPFLGSAVDKFGRKNSCIVYCILEIIINTMEHSTNFQILLLGRVLGGISTNLLFSAFESWMTTEHRKNGFPEEWLSKTYSEVCQDPPKSIVNSLQLCSHP